MRATLTLCIATDPCIVMANFAKVILEVSPANTHLSFLVGNLLIPKFYKSKPLPTNELMNNWTNELIPFSYLYPKMKYLRWLLFPFSLLYGLVVIIRNWCYDAGFFKSYKFTKPVISVGNLDVGGAGKSPMTEYLIRLLKSDYKLATLSRGYGRETKGYLVAENQESRVKNQERHLAIGEIWWRRKTMWIQTLGSS